MAKRRKIVMAPVARDDLFEIVAYIATGSKAGALGYLEKLRKKIGILSQFPLIGKLPRDKHLKACGYRILIVDSYLVFYVVQGSHVRIRRILHGSRDLDRVLF